MSTDDDLARLMKMPGALDEYHGYMHGFHGFPFEGCDMTDLGPHAGAHFEAGLVKGQERAKERLAGKPRGQA